ncbi:MAG: DUF1036 domain-containing protein [Alphaproteobacteria bacterium]
MTRSPLPNALKRGPALFVFGLVLLLAACSSGDDGDEVTETPIPDATETEPIVVNAPRAASAFLLCNLTSSTVGVAVGYLDGETFVTEGWWTLAPQRGENPSCITPQAITEPLGKQYYYVYAVDYTNGGEWAGDNFMCTSDREFTIRGIEDCVTRGYDRTGFVEIDTGDRPTYIVRLTDQQGVGSR